MRSHETPRTESDKHCNQNKANVWAGTAVVILKAKILVNSSVYRSRNKRNGRHQILLLGWVQNRLKISRKMAGITERVGEVSISLCKMGLTGLHDSYGSWRLYSFELWSWSVYFIRVVFRSSLSTPLPICVWQINSRTRYLSSSSWLQELPRVALRAYWNRDRRARLGLDSHTTDTTPIFHILYTRGVLLMPPRVLASGPKPCGGNYLPCACVLFGSFLLQDMFSNLQVFAFEEQNMTFLWTCC